MPKFKVKSFPPVRVDDSLYDQAVKCAGIADELLSVFIRKAVKMRIKQMQDEKCLISQGVLSGKLTPEENIESYNKAKENAKQMERPFKSFQKGGK
jgi:hypothetical protein